MGEHKVRVQIKCRVQLLDGLVVLTSEHLSETQCEPSPGVIAIYTHCGTRPLGGRRQNDRKAAHVPALMDIPETKPSMQP